MGSRARPRGGDELNVIQAGRNYGWPVITYGMNYDGTPMTDRTAQDGMEQPVTYWTPSIAVSSIDFYVGDAFPKWKGNLLVGSLAAQELRRLEIEGTSVTSRRCCSRTSAASATSSSGRTATSTSRSTGPIGSRGSCPRDGGSAQDGAGSG